MSSVNRCSWFKQIRNELVQTLYISHIYITLNLNKKATTLLLVSPKKNISIFRSSIASDEKKKRKKTRKQSTSVQPFNNHEIREAYGETRLKY